MSTIASPIGAHNHLLILQLHNLSPLRGRVCTEDDLKHFDALDLSVERAPGLSQTIDEVDHLGGMRVRFATIRLDNDLLTTARLVVQRSPVAPEASRFTGNRKALHAAGRLIRPTGHYRAHRAVR